MPMIQRSCPNCGTSVGARRYWLLNWWGIRWDCPACSRRLMFSTRHKVLMMLLRLPLMAGVAYAITMHDWRLGLGMFVLVMATESVDTVVLADKG